MHQESKAINEKFWEKINAYVPCYVAGCTEKGMFNNSISRCCRNMFGEQSTGRLHILSQRMIGEIYEVHQ
jgi:hypothetical protein